MRIKRCLPMIFRGSERFAQRLIQVAGQAGRAERPGVVLVQTHHPDHPGLKQLIGQGHGEFARGLLRERAEIGLPPQRLAALFVPMVWTGLHRVSYWSRWLTG